MRSLAPWASLASGKGAGVNRSRLHFRRNPMISGPSGRRSMIRDRGPQDFAVALDIVDRAERVSSVPAVQPRHPGPLGRTAVIGSLCYLAFIQYILNLLFRKPDAQPSGQRQLLPSLVAIASIQRKIGLGPICARMPENSQTVYSPADSISHDDRIELLAGVFGHPHPDAGRHGDHEDGDTQERQSK